MAMTVTRVSEQVNVAECLACTNTHSAVALYLVAGMADRRAFICPNNNSLVPLLKTDIVYP